jgi:hypothetical protein
MYLASRGQKMPKYGLTLRSARLIGARWLSIRKVIVEIYDAILGQNHLAPHMIRATHQLWRIGDVRRK